MHFMGSKIFLLASTESQLSNDGLKILLRRLNVKKSQSQKNSQKCFFCRFLWANCVWIPIVFGNCFICTHHSQNVFFCFHEVLLESCWKSMFEYPPFSVSDDHQFDPLFRWCPELLFWEPNHLIRLRCFMAVTRLLCNFSMLFWFFPLSELWVSFRYSCCIKNFYSEKVV